MKQTTFAGLAYDTKKKRTRREQFLSEMEAVIPCRRLLALLEPHYPVAGQGRRPLGLERMLRVYFMQQWFNLSDPGAEDALYDSESMRRFAGLELGEDAVPDASSMLGFRHLLERHGLTEHLFAEVRALLEERRLWLKAGAIVDATIINAPSSTKNANRARDPEMAHRRRPARHHAQPHRHRCGAGRHPATAGVVAWDETALYGDRAYWCEHHRQCARPAGVRYRVKRRAKSGQPLTEHQKTINASRSRVRARGKHACGVVKHLWGHTKVRYRGLAKHLAHGFTLVALANLYLLRRRLLPRPVSCAR